MDALPAWRTGDTGATGRVAGSAGLFGWAMVGCAACCLGPLLATTGIGTFLAAVFAPSGMWALSALVVGAVAIAIVLRQRPARWPNGVSEDGPMNETIACRLPVSDRAQRAADFRALFADLVDRARVPEGVRWTLRALPTTEAESHRLAALEARCCDGIRFDVSRDGDEVVWHISGPASAKVTLDALYDLPVFIGDDANAGELWTVLDAAACGPQRHS